MSRKKKANGNGHATVASGDVIGREMRIIFVELSDDEIEDRRKKRRRTFELQRQEQATFKAFQKYAEPRLRAAQDPDYTPPEDVEEIDDVDARALEDELTHRRRCKTAAVAKLKADRRLLTDAIANGYEHRLTECECRANVEKLTVQIVDPMSGEVIDERGMTAAQRQMSLPGDEVPSASAAPDAVM